MATHNGDMAGWAVQQERAAADLAGVLDSSFFLALAEPARIELLKVLLLSGRSDVASLTAQLPQDVSVISRHLRILHTAGIVKREKVQRHVYYELDAQACKNKFRSLYQRVECILDTCCPDESLHQTYGPLS
jgi:DNA-binding transcriptional ArsR family regulator